jgi:hypothetical protein
MMAPNPAINVRKRRRRGIEMTTPEETRGGRVVLGGGGRGIGLVGRVLGVVVLLIGKVRLHQDDVVVI